LFLTLIINIIILIVSYFQVKRLEILKFDIQNQNVIIILNITYILAPFTIILIGVQIKIIVLILFLFINSIAISVLNYSFITISQFIGNQSLVLLFIGNVLVGVILDVSKLTLFHFIEDSNSKDLNEDFFINKYYLTLYSVAMFIFALSLFNLTVYFQKVVFKYLTQNKAIYFYDEVFKEFIKNNCNGEFNIEKQIYDSEIKSEVSSIDRKILTDTYVTNESTYYSELTLNEEKRILTHIFNKLPEIFIIMTINTLISNTIFPNIALKISFFNNILTNQYSLNLIIFIYNSFDLLGRIFALFKLFRSTKILYIISSIRLYFLVIFPTILICENMKNNSFLIENGIFYSIHLAMFGFTNGLTLINSFIYVRKNISRSLLGKSSGLLYFICQLGSMLGILLSTFLNYF